MNTGDLQFRPEPSILRRGMSLKNILVVGREDHHRMLLAALLSEEGHSVLASSSGNEALGLIQGGRANFVIIDHCVPELDGMHLLEKIKELKETIPVLVISAQYEVEPYITAMNLGALDYFGKPIDYVEIQRVVNTYDVVHSLPKHKYCS